MSGSASVEHMALRAGSVPSFVVYRGSDLSALLYRVVGSTRPSSDDFLSYAQARRNFRSEDFFRALGVSLWLDRNKAQAMADSGRLGTCVAEVDIRRDDIYWALTSERSRHVTAWAPPALLLRCVVQSWAGEM